MDLGMRDRTVIVTGASGGIGREIALGFAAEGAKVMLTYHGAADQAAQVAEELGDQARTARYVLGDPESATAVEDATVEWTGQVDVLVNNAVAFDRAVIGPPFDEVPRPDWTRMLANNINGYIELSNLATLGMRIRGFGRLVHISTGLVTDGMAGSEYYAAAKAALHGFSRSAAFSLGAAGDILSNVVMPGMTRTALNADRLAGMTDAYAARAPIGRVLDAEEVAKTVVFLGSAANTGLTGQEISVTGGV